ncbi:MAG TPA: ester cyclase [Gaiellaceae bacterium]|nr:ester cyclase [Gaiellaceae bacterium]
MPQACPRTRAPRACAGAQSGSRHIRRGRACIEVTWKGTHTGPLTTAEGAIPASGKPMATPGAVFYTFEGKIKAMRQYFDSLTLLKQLGAQSK